MEFFLLQCVWFVATVSCLLTLFPRCTKSQQVSFETHMSGNNVIVGQDLQLICIPPDEFDINTDKLEIHFQNKPLILFENLVFELQTNTAHYKPDSLILSGGSYIIVTLTINEANLNDTGQYQCIITNSNKQVFFSNILDISVLQIPKPNCSAPDTHDAAFKNNALTIKESSEVSLQCQADFDVNSVPVILHWSRSDGETVSQSSYLLQAMISFSPSIDDDGLAYTCTATNSKYEGANHTCTINISVKKDFVNLNFTDADAGKSDVGLITGVAVTVVVLLVVLIVMGSICLIRTVRKQRDRGDSTFQLSPHISVEISRERQYVANDTVPMEASPEPTRSFPDTQSALINQGNANPVYDEPPAETSSSPNPAGFEQFNKNKVFVLPKISRERQDVVNDTVAMEAEPTRLFPDASSLPALINQGNVNAVYDEPPSMAETSSSPTPASFQQFNKNKVFVLPQLPPRISRGDESFPTYGTVDKNRDHDT